MQAFILVGSTQKQQNYLDSFYKKHNIQPFYIHEFRGFKILDARNLIKLLSKKLHADDKRVVVISQPTIEAQHAILKTIEELSEKVYTFFLCASRDNLLSTIQSRCKVIAFEVISHDEDTELKKDLEKTLDEPDNTVSALLFAEKYGVEKTGIDDVIAALRLALLQNIENEKATKHSFELLKKAIQLQPLIKNNNIQMRFALEQIFSSAS